MQQMIVWFVPYITCGKDADLVIWNYPPFTTQAQAGVVIIGGTVQYQAKPETTNV